MAIAPFRCARCGHVLRSRALPVSSAPQSLRNFSQSSPWHDPSNESSSSQSSKPDENPTGKTESQAISKDTQPKTSDPPDPEPGAMTRLLEQATEDALFFGGRAGRRAIEEAGFSDELKAKLLEKVAAASFNAEHSAALTQAGLGSSKIPSSAGQGTRATATSKPWTGEEEMGDAVLRMLDDARKPLSAELRGKAAPPPPVDMRIRGAGNVSPGLRAANARERAQAYASMGMGKDTGLTEDEKEALKREFRERFSPGYRALPNSISGLAALANERIEDAMARGQFKNIPRGPGVERDTRADNPFIDTTEYIMNKMIKRQDLVPPWIDKQQELVRAAEDFRKRIRTEWKRHAIRLITSRGGSLEDKISRAKAYARAEELHNPSRRKIDQISVPSNTTDDSLKLHQSASSSSASQPSSSTDDAATALRPLRDPQWERSQRSYMELTITHLNSLTRSYNLMAPELAKKPYFSLERELSGCYADVAPLLADEIRTQALRPKESSGGFGGGGGGLLGLFGGGGGLSGTGGGGVTGEEGKEKQYGLRELWRDLWKKG
ncbi:uncharacterized protein CTHT_0001110 [Thermochaetoides thermophila DSM 1495]|uniref:DnaJ homologue subfamily C member 28 conserved domain-containing protein n=1 Tax=Chaetomium thermophilum (strain DSM 1495 / CBS 144.50 / IMI 039719) TaxID=759272 RepID=G0RYZ4_CHATD|nr:hypothetical protein CTHT_0001110 [Thermochaetoides thermophila DSM 1495]EGS23422.1 hypothetical protein CTHT_0001110 [Thermochaetoides thermophila DSM 1495]